MIRNQLKRKQKPGRFRVHHLCLVLLVISLFLNLLVYGGLTRLPQGKVFRDSARREAPLVLGYMAAGEQLMRVPGMASFGESLALDAYGPLFERAQQNPGAAMDVVANAEAGTATSLARFNHWATPCLLLLWILSFVLRPREVHLVRR